MTNIDLDQARRRAKELLEAARAGDPTALEQLPKPHDPVLLADAQLAIARALGYPSWPKLVAAEAWRPATYEDVDWKIVRRLTLVPFLEGGADVVIPDTGLPTDELQPGEDALLDAALRIPLEQAGFRRQATHVFALRSAGTHVAMWIEGSRYQGRRPHRHDATWWTGDPDNVDDNLVRLAAQARRSLTRDQHVTDMRRLIDPIYLAADTPQGGSGFSGTLEEWHDNHRHIADAIQRDGTFLDIGCANGFLMECIAEWCAERGLTITPYGVDISPALAALARQRLPHWANNIWVGDAATWTPDRTFDYVHWLLDPTEMTGLDANSLIDRMLTFVTPGGRLILSCYSPAVRARALVEPLGYRIEGGDTLGVWLRR